MRANGAPGPPLKYLIQVKLRVRRLGPLRLQPRKAAVRETGRRRKTDSNCRSPPLRRGAFLNRLLPPSSWQNQSKQRYSTREGPVVRIRLPPAESLSLSRSCFRGSRTPAFRAAVRGWLGDRVGRDAQGVSR